MEKIISEDSSDTSCNSPFVWMMVKHLDRTDTKLNKVQSLSHQNHIAINNMKGKIVNDEVTEIKSLLNGIQKKMRNMQFEIDNLKRRCSTNPGDWVLFSGHNYMFVYKKVTWNIAKIDCQQKGGYLAKVESGAENSWLISVMKDEVWIGLNDIQSEGQWKWISDNTGISFSYWPSNQPSSKRRENCVQYCKERCGMKSYGWNDESCGSRMGYVCEKQLEHS
ncbi:Hypothetical predicted protein [Mytilus galloprovincialis]|nr:Hypothetical predicted protein [Mytilus galloprovincialis]